MSTLQSPPEEESALTAHTHAPPAMVPVHAQAASPDSTSSRASARLPVLQVHIPSTASAHVLQVSSPMATVSPSAITASPPSTESALLAIPTVLNAQAALIPALLVSLALLLMPPLNAVSPIHSAHTDKNLLTASVETFVTVDSSTMRVSAFMVDASLAMLITASEDVSVLEVPPL